MTGSPRQMKLIPLLAVLLWPGPAAGAGQDSSPILPPLVTETLSRAFPGIKPGKVRAHELLGLKLYEAVVGESQATVAGDGTLAAIETSAGALPPSVTEGAAKAVKGARIESARKVDARARLAFSPLSRPTESYALSISKDGKRGTLQVGGDGTVLQPLRWEKAEKGKREPGTAGPETSGEAALPASALEALRKAFPDPTVNEVESLFVLGTIIYDVEVISRLGERQVHVTHDGILLATDQDAPAAALPQAVLDSAARAAGAIDACMARKRAVLAAASLVRLGAPSLAFRVRMVHPGGHARIDFSLDGAPLGPPLPFSPGAVAIDELPSETPARSP